MKVRINQAIDLEEVPDKLREIVYGIQSDYEKLQSKLDDCVHISSLTGNSSMQYKLLMNNIHTLRTELTNIDGVLSDLNSVLEGYINILEPPVQPQSPAPQSPPERDTNDAD